MYKRNEILNNYRYTEKGTLHNFDETSKFTIIDRGTGRRMCQTNSLSLLRSGSLNPTLQGFFQGFMILTIFNFSCKDVNLQIESRSITTWYSNGIQGWLPSTTNTIKDQVKN